MMIGEIGDVKLKVCHFKRRSTGNSTGNGDYDILTQQDNVSYTSNFANFRHCKMVDPLITHILGKNQELLCFLTFVVAKNCKIT